MQAQEQFEMGLGFCKPVPGTEWDLVIADKADALFREFCTSLAFPCRSQLAYSFHSIELTSPKKIHRLDPGYLPKLVSTTLGVYCRDKLRRGKSLEHVSLKLTSLERDIERRRRADPRSVSRSVDLSCLPEPDVTGGSRQLR